VTEQQGRALERANAVRAIRAERKVEMKSGKLDITGLLLDPPWWAEGMKATDFLLACPKVGPIKTGRIIGAAKVRPTDRLGKMPLTTRCYLCTLLPR